MAKQNYRKGIKFREKVKWAQAKSMFQTPAVTL